ncbi:hypothetical protein K432DRAFT_225015 [Lepidopterella palustris CBS 459.81]|uniref:BZIP domain-containing protein n=1 Tax=Lepidopterella palustris CBS 459.81 TaxID=1314670 RepID=A0A8E2EE23_9PEZI|nr:hypothetical protein K432DRAFT_225015 [Lepidopterella palustris CBS 459.81]
MAHETYNGRFIPSQSRSPPSRNLNSISFSNQKGKARTDSGYISDCATSLDHQTFDNDGDNVQSSLSNSVRFFDYSSHSNLPTPNYRLGTASPDSSAHHSPSFESSSSFEEDILRTMDEKYPHDLHWAGPSGDEAGGNPALHNHHGPSDNSNPDVGTVDQDQDEGDDSDSDFDSENGLERIGDQDTETGAQADLTGERAATEKELTGDTPPKLKGGRKRKDPPAGEEDEAARAKRERNLERNRQAASKCRLKKKEHTNALEEKCRALANANNSLRAYTQSLNEARLVLLNDVLLASYNSSDPRLHLYLQQRVNTNVQHTPLLPVGGYNPLQPPLSQPNNRLPTLNFGSSNPVQGLPGQPSNRLAPGNHFAMYDSAPRSSSQPGNRPPASSVFGGYHPVQSSPSQQDNRPSAGTNFGSYNAEQSPLGHPSNGLQASSNFGSPNTPGHSRNTSADTPSPEYPPGPQYNQLPYRFPQGGYQQNTHIPRPSVDSGLGNLSLESPAHSRVNSVNANVSTSQQAPRGPVFGAAPPQASMGPPPPQYNFNVSYPGADRNARSQSFGQQVQSSIPTFFGDLNPVQSFGTGHTPVVPPSMPQPNDSQSDSLEDSLRQGLQEALREDALRQDALRQDALRESDDGEVLESQSHHQG